MSVETQHRDNALIIEDKSNGHGYRLYCPDDVGFLQPDLQAAFEPRFEEMGGIMQAVEDSGSALVSGEPGAGKTNLVQDIEEYYGSTGTPVLRLSMHINAGKRNTLGHTQNLLNNFVESSADDHGLLVIDNVDYFGYRSRSRSRPRTLEYAQQLVPSLLAAMEAPHVSSLGTAHTQEWQETHWQWQEPELDELQKELIGAFAVKLPFEGKVGLGGVRKIIAARFGSEANLIEDVSRRLVELGIQTFHVAKHVDLEAFRRDPVAAIREVHEGRQQKMRASSATIQSP